MSRMQSNFLLSWLFCRKAMAIHLMLTKRVQDYSNRMLFRSPSLEDSLQNYYLITTDFFELEQQFTAHFLPTSAAKYWYRALDSPTLFAICFCIWKLLMVASAIIFWFCTLECSFRNANIFDKTAWHKLEYTNILSKRN